MLATPERTTDVGLIELLARKGCEKVTPQAVGSKRPLATGQRRRSCFATLAIGILPRPC
jgi:hypothetical protein